MKYLDIANQELDILMMEANVYTSQIPLECLGLTMEKSETSIFQKIIEKLTELVSKVKEKINSFINSVTIKKKTEDLDKILEENPELKNNKVKVPNYDKVRKLNDDTLKQLKKTKDPETLMKKYRKQRNILLGALGFVTVTLGGAALYLKKNFEHRNFIPKWDVGRSESSN